MKLLILALIFIGRVALHVLYIIGILANIYSVARILYNIWIWHALIKGDLHVAG